MNIKAINTLSVIKYKESFNSIIEQLKSECSYKYIENVPIFDHYNL
jgi:HEAT repeat protein